jgi:hypothetical protein
VPRWQYQGRAEPLSTTGEVVLLDKWQPEYPDNPTLRKVGLIAAIVAGSFFSDSKPITTVDTSQYLDRWSGSYPDYINKRKQQPTVGWTAIDANLLTNKETIFIDKWQPIYPVRLDRSKRVLPLDFTTIDAHFGFAPVVKATLDSWIPTYPSRLDRVKRIFAGIPFFWDGGEKIESIFINKWIPTYPNRLDPRKPLVREGLYSCVLLQVATVLTMDYYRRYLNDTTGSIYAGPAVSLPAGIETDDTTYFRRYLDDPST